MIENKIIDYFIQKWNIKEEKHDIFFIIFKEELWKKTSAVPSYNSSIEEKNKYLRYGSLWLNNQAIKIINYGMEESNFEEQFIDNLKMRCIEKNII